MATSNYVKKSQQPQEVPSCNSCECIVFSKHIFKKGYCQCGHEHASKVISAIVAERKALEAKGIFINHQKYEISRENVPFFLIN